MNPRFVEHPGYGSEPVVVHSDNHRVLPLEWAGACLRLGQVRVKQRFMLDACFWLLMGKHIANAEVFEFGQIKDAELKAESKRGAPLWTQGYLRMPFRSSIYWYTHESDPEVLAEFERETGHKDAVFQRGRFATLAVEAPRFFSGDAHIPEELSKMKEGFLGSDWNDPVVFIADFIRFDEMRGDAKCAYVLANAAVVAADKNNKDIWHGRLIDSVSTALGERDPKQASMHVGSLADGVVGLSMILNTKNIPTRVEHPSAKLNAKRASNGKPPLVRVTHVDSAKYHEAVKNTRGGGTHASPAPHLRRGHLRTYSDGHKVWIKDMLVNCRSVSELKNRDHYEVTT